MFSEVWYKISYPFLNFNSCNIEICEWTSNFIIHFIMDLITYPGQESIQSMLVKGAPAINSMRPSGTYMRR